MTRERLQDRRGFLRWSATALTASACTRPEPAMPDQRQVPTMPVVFVSHGAPSLALDQVAGADFARLAGELPAPRAILVVSAHWLQAPPTIGTRTPRALLHDYSGFPPELARLRYDAPAAGPLADELRARLPGLARADDRPWDHGVWVPLLHMYPRRDVPVLQLSMPYTWTPQQMFELGRQLAPLRAENVLVLASGGAVHNLGRLDWRGGAEPPSWASEFEGWLRERLAARAFDDVLAFRERAPGVQLAHPTVDHFVPLLVAAGAGADAARVDFPIHGWEFGSLSRLAARFA